MGLYRMIISAQQDDSHQSKFIRLKWIVNVVPRDMVYNKLFALQVERKLKRQSIRILVEWPNSDTEQNWEMLSEETILSNISKTLVCQIVL